METTQTHSLGARIRQLREERGWSQEELAQKVGVRGLAVGKWERGQANPTTENRAHLASAFGVDPAEMGVRVYVPTEAAPEWFTRALEDHTRQILAAIDAQGRDLRARLPRR